MFLYPALKTITNKKWENLNTASDSRKIAITTSAVCGKLETIKLNFESEWPSKSVAVEVATKYPLINKEVAVSGNPSMEKLFVNIKISSTVCLINENLNRL